ncbi:LysR family transcriptional regulator [Caenimonas sedimenti]|uniref:LysR family transcriptional regulator n=1 Tax=Caenimonas sedimenti TaxID=2596921 RepID=A0A562ZX47_9BURK|nr:LysR family transcriptional regulator [Caenimonas sedimenti]TWO72865.1 LysR family transcriptional regulator [Caenimonas sedimenti]
MPAVREPDLNALLLFAAVAETGSFTAAADRLDVAKAKVSLAVSRLEAQLGTQLFSRTTRRVVLTEAGQGLYAQCVPALRGVQESLAQMAGGGELHGTLRISAAVEYAAQTLAPAVAAFAAAHPRLEVDLRTSDRVVDMLKEGIDVSVRMGWLRDSSLRATRLTTFEQHVVASPAYLRRAPPIRQPADLVKHDWVALMLLPTPLTWKFTSAAGQVRTVRVAGRMRTDAASTLRALLVQGCGVSVMDEFTTEAPLRSGALVRLLPNWSLPRGGVHAVVPPGARMSTKARAFVDFYADWLKAGRGA